MRVLWIAGLICAGMTCAAVAQNLTATVTIRRTPDDTKAFDQIKASKAALPGQEIRVWAAQMLEPDCTAHGSMDMKVIEPPKHGTARVSDDEFFANYPIGNVRYACNKKKTPGKQVFYTAAADFHGHDKMVVQNSTSEGRIRKIDVDIDVR